MAATIKVHGAAEAVKAFREIDKQLAKDLGNDLKEAAAPVVAAAKQKVTAYDGASVNTIRARRSGPRVYVEQGAKKVTGNRGDFGALQMVEVLIPALDEKSDEVLAHVDGVLTKYALSAGF